MASVTESTIPGSQLRVGVLDYGCGNIHSACRALEKAGAAVVLSNQVSQLADCDGLVVPGVGSFESCMAGLNAVSGPAFIRDWVSQNRPLLGICVGHQVLFAAGVEHGVETAGVGIYPGVVAKLPAARLPHMGWNLVEPAPGSELFNTVTDQRFYFVHSYALLAGDGLPSGAKVSYAVHEGARFVASLEWGNVCSTQFHPEKSADAGLALLKNWIAKVAAAAHC